MQEQLLHIEQPKTNNDNSNSLLNCQLYGFGADKKYNIIYADPPWNYTVFDNKHGGRSENQYYNTMRYVDICSLPIQDICEDDCALFLWATLPLLPEAIYLIRAWGFTYKTVAFTWVKTNKKNFAPFFGMGQYTRTNAELCLLGIKGKPKRENADVSQVILSPIDEHSKKPAEARDRIIRLFGELPRIELFARQKAEGWDVWGNQAPNSI